MTYPPELKAKKIAGVVVLHYVIGSDGRIEPLKTRVIRTSDPAFTAAVIAILPTGHFTPAKRAKKTVRELVEQAFLFSPQR